MEISANGVNIIPVTNPAIRLASRGLKDLDLIRIAADADMAEEGGHSKEYWAAKGNELCDQGKYDEAILAYDEAIRINPQYPSAWKNKGGALSRLGRIAEADAAFARAKELGYEG